MKRAFIVIDMQKDFVGGCLGSKEAQAIVNPMVEAVKDEAAKTDVEILFTRDTHQENYMETQEGKNLPVPHCIEGSDGWEIIDELQQFIGEETKIFNKPTFGSVELASYLKNESFDEVTFVGVCTGICVISNAMLAKAYMPETKVNVIGDLCACVSKESHKTALEAMKLCQINVL